MKDSLSLKRLTYLFKLFFFPLPFPFLKERQSGKNGARISLKSLVLQHSRIHLSLLHEATQTIEIQNIFSPPDNISVNTILQYKCFLPDFII